MSAPSTSREDSQRPFKCETCGSRYTRQEHLDRHVVAKHSAVKEFVCATCHKAFARRDILKRHELGHERNNPSPSSKDVSEDDDPQPYSFGSPFMPSSSKRRGSDIIYDGSVKVKQPRVAKACARCSKSKLRCDGEEPCSRCDKANLECIYDRRASGKARAAPDSAARDQSMTMYDPPSSLAAAPRNPYDLPVSLSSMPGHVPAVTHIPPYGPAPQPGMFNNFGSSNIASNFLPSIPQYAYPAPYLPSTDRNDAHAFSSPFAAPGPHQQGQSNPMSNAGINHPSPLTAWISEERPSSSHGRKNGQTGHNANDFLDLLASHGDQEADIDWSVLDVHAPREAASPGQAVEQARQAPSGTVSSARTPMDPGSATNSLIDPAIAASDSNGAFTDASPTSTNIQEAAVASLLQLASHTPRHSPEPEKGGRAAQSAAAADPWPLAYRPTQPVETFASGGRSRAVSPDPRDLKRYKVENALVPRITAETRDRILAHVSDVTRDYSPFADSHRWIPPVEILDLFIQLFFERYHPHLPIIHVPTFDPNTCHPFLTLCVASTGARYAHDRIAGSSTYAFALLELARRLSQVMGDLDNRVTRTVQWHQATILSLFAGFSSGNKRDLERSQASRTVAITFCRRQGWLRDAEVDVAEERKNYTVEERWYRWRDREEIKRLGFATILLDGLGTSMWDLESLTVFLDATHATIPCHDALWEADSATTWASMFRGSDLPAPAPKLREAVVAICDRTSTQHEQLRSCSHDQFAMTSILTVISLIGWLKQRETLTTTLFLPNAPQWEDSLAASPIFVALDAGLDYFQDRVLLPPEIQAMLPDVGAAANVLALMLHHTAMTVRLPLRVLQPLARTGVAPLSPCVNDALRTWVSEDDGRVARRTAFHAGQLFALARQGNGDGPMESAALFYAALALLTFIQECVRPQMTGASKTGRVVELDKFVDRNDQDVVDWINGGQTTARASLSRIGPLDEPLAADKMLRIAIEKLSSEKTWRVCELLAKQLTIKLEEEQAKAEQ